MNKYSKIGKCIYITPDNVKKLEILKENNYMNYSAIINFLIAKQKKVKLI